jgi:hypothetical protein
MAKKANTPSKPAMTPADTTKRIQQLETEKAYLEQKSQILLAKLDRKEARLDWAFRHPIKFALGRIYHQNIKRDQRNVEI